MENKIEMHLHVKGTSHCARADSKTIIADYKANNYTGIVCTNHWNSTSLSQVNGFLFSTKLKNFVEIFKNFKSECENNGIKVYFGIELSLHKKDYRGLRQNCFEILVYGISLEEFIEYNKKLIHMSNEKLKALADEKNWVLIQSHPFRPCSTQLDINYVHGYEVYNSHKGHKENNNLSLAFCTERNGIKTCGSDYHCTGMQKTGIIVDTLPNDEKELARLLKSKQYTLSHPDEIL